MNKFKKFFNFILVMLVVTISLPLSAFASEEINNITSAKTEENQNSENTDKKSEETTDSSNAEANEENKLNETNDEKTTQDSVENNLEEKNEKEVDARDKVFFYEPLFSENELLQVGKIDPNRAVASADINFKDLTNAVPAQRAIADFGNLKAAVEAQEEGELAVYALAPDIELDNTFDTINIDKGQRVVITSLGSKATVKFGEGTNSLNKHLFSVTNGTIDVNNVDFVGTLPEGAVAAKNLGTAAPENPNMTAGVFSVDGRRAKANFYNNIEFKNQKIRLDQLTRCGGFAVVKSGATSNVYGGKFHNLQVDGVGGTFYVGQGFNSTANYFLGEYYDQWNTDGGGPFDNNDAESFVVQRWLGTSVYNNYSKSQGDWYAFAIKGNRAKGENNTEGTQQIYGNTKIYDNYLFDNTSGAITQRSDWGALYDAYHAASAAGVLSYPDAYKIYNPTPNTNIWIGQSQHHNLDKFFNTNPYGGANGYVVLAEIVYTDASLEQKYANNGVAEGIHGDWEDASNADGTISKTGNYRVVEKQIDGKNYAVLEKRDTEVTVKGVDNSKPQNTLYTDDPVLITSEGKSVVDVKKQEGYVITGAKATGSGIFPETELTPVRDAGGEIIGFEIDPNNDKEITIEVQYVPSYTIVFDKNYGPGMSVITGHMAPQEIGVDQTVALSPNKFASEDGYTFSGWNTEADGSGKSYADGQEVTNIAAKGEKVVLYAQWTPNSPDPVVPEQPVQPEVKPTTPVETKPQTNVPTGVKVGLSSAIILVIVSLSLIVIKRTRK